MRHRTRSNTDLVSTQRRVWLCCLQCAPLREKFYISRRARIEWEEGTSANTRWHCISVLLTVELSLPHGFSACVWQRVGEIIWINLGLNFLGASEINRPNNIVVTWTNQCLINGPFAWWSVNLAREQKWQILVNYDHQLSSGSWFIALCAVNDKLGIYTSL